MGGIHMEMYLKIKDVLNCTKGELIIGNAELLCENFTIDTRKLNVDDIYIGIKGENFDGNILWQQALDKGAKAVIVENIDFKNENLEKYNNKTIIKVKNTVNALQEIAKYKRRLYGKDFPVIGVTGSVGKTSTKDVIASVLSKKYKVLKTEGNNNNGLGLPLTILKLKDHDIAVIEMGMNHMGEISELTKIAKPTISVITNVGTSHIGNLGSRENILKAKLEILEGMEKPILVCNNDNDLLHKWAEDNKNKIEIKTYGIQEKGDIWADNIKLNETCSYFKCHMGEEEIDIKIPVGGIHFVYNALVGIIVGKMNNLKNEEIILGLEQVEVAKKRMEKIELKDNITLINDSYNASYESMKAAIEYLNNIEIGRKIAVLGDMLELGKYAIELHKKVGKEVANNNIDILICSGENSKYIIEEAIENGMNKDNTYYENNIEEVEKRLTKLTKENDNVLIKASNGMQFYKLAESIVEKWRNDNE